MISKRRREGGEDRSSFHDDLGLNMGRREEKVINKREEDTGGIEEMSWRRANEGRVEAW